MHYLTHLLKKAEIKGLLIPFSKLRQHNVFEDSNLVNDTPFIKMFILKNR